MPSPKSTGELLVPEDVDDVVAPNLPGPSRCAHRPRHRQETPHCLRIHTHHATHRRATRLRVEICGHFGNGGEVRRHRDVLPVELGLEVAVASDVVRRTDELAYGDVASPTGLGTLRWRR